MDNTVTDFDLLQGVNVHLHCKMNLMNDYIDFEASCFAVVMSTSSISSSSSTYFEKIEHEK